MPKRDIEEEDYIYKVPCEARETISLRDSTYITKANKKRKRGDKNYQGEMEELPDYPKDRNAKGNSKEAELDTRR